MRLSIAATLLIAASAAPLAGQEAPPADSFSFVVLGHIRGGANGEFNYIIDEILDDVARTRPDLVVLTGDMIWGDYQTTGTTDTAALRQDWDTLDAMMSRLGVPVLLVPGNHDLHDPGSRDLFLGRYGPLPRVVDFHGSRLILLSSAYIPPGDTLPGRRYIRGVPLDSAQRAFVREALADTAAYEHAFLFMHHMLWWEDDAPWWSEVHPLLAGRVEAVFAGDYGPMKFSHLERDGVHYLQSSVEGYPTTRILQSMISSRLLYQQFDNFLHVTVAGPAVSVDVEAVGAITGAKYTPARWREINAPLERTLMERARRFLESPRRLAALLLLGAGSFGAGVITALLWPRRRQRSTELTD